MISGHGNIETAVQATKLGAFDFIEKPFSIDALLQVVNRALEHRALLGTGRGDAVLAALSGPGRQRARGAAPHDGADDRQVRHRQRPRPAHRREVGAHPQPAAGRARHRVREPHHRGVGAGAHRLRRLDRLRDDAARRRHDRRHRRAPARHPARLRHHQRAHQGAERGADHGRLGARLLSADRAGRRRGPGRRRRRDRHPRAAAPRRSRAGRGGHFDRAGRPAQHHLHAGLSAAGRAAAAHVRPPRRRALPRRDRPARGRSAS